MTVKLCLTALPFAFILSASTAWAVPAVGQTVPAFRVEDLAGTMHTQSDLTGRWRVVLAMTDKDIGSAITAWYSRIATVAPPGSQMLTFAALDLFPLVPSATVFSDARGATPRDRWSEVWLSRNGSLATSLGLTDSEVPWVFVIDPSGVVVESVHALLDEPNFARIAAALRRARAPQARVTQDAGAPRAP